MGYEPNICVLTLRRILRIMTCVYAIFKINAAIMRARMHAYVIRRPYWWLAGYTMWEEAFLIKHSSFGVGVYC